MEILIYNDLDYSKAKKQFEKTVNYLKAGDFKSADVKKMVNTGFYRAKLDDTNRLLFKYTNIEDQKYLLLLEVIYNHDYENSRFLNGAIIDEAKLPLVNKPEALETDTSQNLTYINTKRNTFHILDKILSFDEIQDEIFQLPSPLIIIGSAGSGKTALTLEKIKTLHGRVLYISLSSYLVENSQSLYYSYGYDNPNQEVSFLSFYDYLSTIEIPKGKEIDFRTFEQWIWRFKQSHKIKDAYKVYEEFKGVITGSIVDKPYLSEEDYLNLGVKQSIFLESERPLIYDLFKKYVEYLEEGQYFDSNLFAYQCLEKVTKQYDFVVVDEVQDITNIQLYLIIKSLNNSLQFILCGDSNQIVHPNFFSWTNIKSLFYKQELKGNIIRVLATNYRNTPEVTKIANQLLLIKNARFGSIDKESTYLVKTNSQHKGEVQFYENNNKIKQDFNQRTQGSARFAVIVMRNEDKEEARKFFKTPLLFSIHEVKGLEYENIILFNIISKYEKEFRELTTGVSKEDIKAEEINFGRAKDKTDKSLDEYKFYVNSLYVAITRAVKNLYVIETNKKHALLELLDLTNFQNNVGLKEQKSTDDEWQKEAQKLEKQGKKEQADAIKKQILKIEQVPWEIITRQNLPELEKQAFNPEHFNKKAKDRLFDYALFYEETHYYPTLFNLNYKPADPTKIAQAKGGLIRRNFTAYYQDNIKPVEQQVRKYGLDFKNEFNLTPFMLSIIYDAEKISKFLLENGAKTNFTDNYGRTVLQLLMLKGYADQKFKQNLNQHYHKLKQDSLKVKVGNQLIKIDSHQAEYLMLNMMISTLHLIIGKTLFSRGSFYFLVYESASFVEFYEGLSSKVIPQYRAQRPYISSILAKNEVNSDNQYNKKLFFRIKRGFYLINPLLEIQQEDEWINIYELLSKDWLTTTFGKKGVQPFLNLIEGWKAEARNVIE